MIECKKTIWKPETHQVKIADSNPQVCIMTDLSHIYIYTYYYTIIIYLYNIIYILYMNIALFANFSTCFSSTLSWHQSVSTTYAQIYWLYISIQQRDARTEDVYLQVASLAIGPSEVRFQGNFCPTNRQRQVEHLKIEQQPRFCTSVFAISSPAQTAWISYDFLVIGGTRFLKTFKDSSAINNP